MADGGVFDWREACVTPLLTAITRPRYKAAIFHGGIFTREGLFHGGQNSCDTLGDEVTDKQMDIAIASSPLWPCGTVLIK